MVREVRGSHSEPKSQKHRHLRSPDDNSPHLCGILERRVKDPSGEDHSEASKPEQRSASHGAKQEKTTDNQLSSVFYPKLVNEGTWTKVATTAQAPTKGVEAYRARDHEAHHMTLVSDLSEPSLLLEHGSALCRQQWKTVVHHLTFQNLSEFSVIYITAKIFLAWPHPPC